MLLLFCSPEIPAGKNPFRICRFKGNLRSSVGQGTDDNISLQSLAIPGQKCKNVKPFEQVPIV
jgi:hypothetical protein